MSRILDNYELYTLPLDVIMGINRIWRDGVKMHDPKWEAASFKNPNYDINQYIGRHFPELKAQFEWEQMTGNERMAKKYGKIKTARAADHYDGTNSHPTYDRDLDPFYDNE